MAKLAIIILQEISVSNIKYTSNAKYSKNLY